jgi:small subunit ribosomal protein S16
MAVKIRLARTGRHKRASYRIVVANSESPRDGRFLEILGHYNPLTAVPEVKIDMERARTWLAQGAQPSDTVKQLLAKQPAAQ